MDGDQPALVAGFTLVQSSDANRYRMLAEEARRGAADMRDDLSGRAVKITPTFSEALPRPKRALAGGAARPGLFKSNAKRCETGLAE